MKKLILLLISIMPALYGMNDLDNFDISTFPDSIQKAFKKVCKNDTDNSLYAIGEKKQKIVTINKDGNDYRVFWYNVSPSGDTKFKELKRLDEKEFKHYLKSNLAKINLRYPEKK